MKIENKYSYFSFDFHIIVVYNFRVPETRYIYRIYIEASVFEKSISQQIEISPEAEKQPIFLPFILCLLLPNNIRKYSLYIYITSVFRLFLKIIFLLVYPNCRPLHSYGLSIIIFYTFFQNFQIFFNLLFYVFLIKYSSWKLYRVNQFYFLILKKSNKNTKQNTILLYHVVPEQTWII